MPDPSIGPRYSGNSSSSSSKSRTVDTSSLSGIEAASKAPTTEQKLSTQPTTVSNATGSTPVIRDPKPMSSSGGGGETAGPPDTQLPRAANNVVAGAVVATAITRDPQISGHPTATQSLSLIHI